MSLVFPTFLINDADAEGEEKKGQNWKKAMFLPTLSWLVNCYYFPEGLCALEFNFNRILTFFPTALQGQPDTTNSDCNVRNKGESRYSQPSF